MGVEGDKVIDSKGGLRRLAFFRVAPEVLTNILVNREWYTRVGDEWWKVEVHGPPVDAEGLRCGIDEHGNVCVVYTSEELEELNEKDRLPETEMRVTCRRIGRGVGGMGQLVEGTIAKGEEDGGSEQ